MRLLCTTTLAAAVPLTLLPEDAPGKCMDGTPAGYFLEPATSNGDSGKWVIFLEGGGECAKKEDCDTKITTTLGSSKYFPSDAAPYQFASSDQDENPAMHTWNRVLVKYCSQDLWSGTVDQPSDASYGYHFAGHLILSSVVEHLNLSSAEQVVLSGASAGGIGSWINVGWLQRKLPQAKVVVAPIAGFYSFAYPYTGPGAQPGGLADFREEAWPGHVQLWGSYLEPKCAEALGDRSYACMLSNYSRPFLDVPAFVVEAQTDKVQLQAHDSIPAPKWNTEEEDYVKNWGANMTRSIKAQLREGDGRFSPACYIHTDFSKAGPFLSGMTYGQAFAKWLSGEAVQLDDDCGILCGQCSSVLV